jgi:bifunctional NMN adenylyltransferase/nudix hydrolase
MSQKKYEHVFFIGRFQPLHDGHVSVIDHAITLAHNVHILIGSSNVARSIRNPFTFKERSSFIKDHFKDKVQTITPINDYPYNDKTWAKEVIQAIYNVTDGYNEKVAIIGHTKEDTAYYLSLFSIYSLKLEEVPETIKINATEIRKLYFSSHTSDLFLKVRTTETVKNFLKSFELSSSYLDLQAEFLYAEKYKKDWSSSPYPPIFVTVDSVVVDELTKKILLIRRKSNPGKNLLALPGGFLDQKETLLQASIRELKEETCLNISEQILKSSLKSQHTFDHPLRSIRGRTISNAFYFSLTNTCSLDLKVTAADDAISAGWYSLSEIQSENMFEDHYSIIQHFLHTTKAT